MADQLATPEDLAALLQKDLDRASDELAVEVSTAVVQACVGQRIVRVSDDPFEIPGTTSSWLRLPEFPVVSVLSVSLDGVPLTAGAPGSGGETYRLIGNRLWRGCGWQTYCGEPSLVSGVNTHGYAAGVQKLQFARGVVLSLARGLYENPTGATQERIDDYAVAYAAAEAALDARPSTKALLRKQYGRRAGFVAIG